MKDSKKNCEPGRLDHYVKSLLAIWETLGERPRLREAIPQA